MLCSITKWKLLGLFVRTITITKKIFSNIFFCILGKSSNDVFISDEYDEALFQ